MVIFSLFTPPPWSRPPFLQATVEDLKRAFSELKRKYYPSRQRWTLQPREGQRAGEALAPRKKLSDYGITDGTTLIFKDLGPQVGYAAVFFWEYFGPLVIYPLIYYLPGLVYPWAHRWVAGSMASRHCIF